ncbi:MAG: prolipoprotein diacylglyceryl transferase [Anaerolineae bacterium]|nr:prolipoprotein diacylglyceryl transferase [Anaerolineae bacterium]
MDPVIFRIGPLAIRWYGVLVVTGVLAAAWLSTVEARRRGEDPDHVWNALSLCLILGIIGARLYHVFSSSSLTGIGWSYYREHPIDIIAFWKGGFRGLGIFGAVAGGIVALAIYSYWAKLRFVRWLDIAAPGVLLAQAIGRWGNFFNQELYGKPTDLPWAIYIDPAHRLPGYEQFERFHPTFLYESLWNLAMCLLLLWIARRFAKWLLEGDIFLLYVVFYCVGRTWVQTLRLDQWIVGQGVPFEQVLPAALAFLAAAIIVVRHYVLRQRPAGEAAGPPLAASAVPAAMPEEQPSEEPSAGEEETPGEDEEG